jgi:hypothetical protein
MQDNHLMSDKSTPEQLKFGSRPFLKALGDDRTVSFDDVLGDTVWIGGGTETTNQGWIDTPIG